METTREKIRKFFGNRIVPKTKELLLDLADVASDFVTLATVMPHEYSALRYGGVNYVRVLRYERADRAIRKRLHALRQSEYITMRTIGKKLYCALTDRGIAEVLRLRCRTASQCPKGKCVLVTFDIPEKERRSRTHFRRFLGACGFVMHQRSVWTCDRDVFTPLQEFIKRAEIAQWVSVFIAMND